MPTYQFQSNKTGEEWEDTMSWKKLDEYYKKHDCQQVFYSMAKVISTTGDITQKTSDGFKDKMKDIHKMAGRKSQMFKGPKDRNMIYHNTDE